MSKQIRLGMARLVVWTTITKMIKRLNILRNLNKKYAKIKHGGLDLSRNGLDQDSRSRRRQRVSLDSRENLDSVKKLVSTIEISRSRSRLLDFVSTTMSRPKSLDRDREICRDLKFSAFLDSLSRSRPRSAWIFAFSRRDFSIRRDFRPWQCRDFSTNLDRVSTNLENLDVSRQISTISTRLDNLDKNLDASKSQLKSHNFKNLDQEKKKLISTVKKISTL